MRSPAGVDDGRPGIPSDALWLARVQLALIVLGLLVAGVTAIAIRVELWTPEAHGDLDAYARMLTLHGATMASVVVPLAVFGVLANLVIHDCMPIHRRPTWPLAAAGLVAWVGGAIGVLVITLSASPWTFYDPSSDPTPLRAAVGAVVSGMALSAVHLAVVTASGAARARAAAASVSGAIVLAMIGRVIAIAIPWVEHLRMGMDAYGQPVGGGLAAATWLDAVAALVVLLWILGRTLARRASRSDPSPWIIGPALALLSIVGLVARRLPRRLELDVHLHDTTFEVGVFHLGGAVVVLALLAGVLAWSEPLLRLRVRAASATIAMALLALGMFGHAASLLVLGARGMPRRYVAYPDAFVELHQLASGFAALAAVGAVLFVLSFARARTRG